MKVEWFLACERVTLSPNRNMSIINVVNQPLVITKDKLPVVSDMTFVLRVSGRPGESANLTITVIKNATAQKCGEHQTTLELPPDRDFADGAIQVAVTIAAAGDYTALLNVTNSNGAEARSVWFNFETPAVH